MILLLLFSYQHHLCHVDMEIWMYYFMSYIAAASLS